MVTRHTAFTEGLTREEPTCISRSDLVVPWDPSGSGRGRAHLVCWLVCPAGGTGILVAMRDSCPLVSWIQCCCHFVTRLQEHGAHHLTTVLHPSHSPPGLISSQWRIPSLLGRKASVPLAAPGPRRPPHPLSRRRCLSPLYNTFSPHSSEDLLFSFLSVANSPREMSPGSIKTSVPPSLSPNLSLNRSQPKEKNDHQLPKLMSETQSSAPRLLYGTWSYWPSRATDCKRL